MAPGRLPSGSPRCWALSPRAAGGPGASSGAEGGAAWGRGRGAGRGRGSRRRPGGVRRLYAPVRRDPRGPTPPRVAWPEGRDGQERSPAWAARGRSPGLRSVLPGTGRGLRTGLRGERARVGWGSWDRGQGGSRILPPLENGS